MIENTELETVIAIPPIPFVDGEIAWAAHEKNIDFLIRHNFLSGNRKRAIALGGTSLIHHVTSEESSANGRSHGSSNGERMPFLSRAFSQARPLKLLFYSKR